MSISEFSEKKYFYMSKSFFAENLKNIRKLKKISLEELSLALNMSKSTLSDYENEKSSPTLLACRKLADYFGIDLANMEYSEILEITSNTPPKIIDELSQAKQISDLRENKEVLEKQKNKLITELKLQTQKIESLHIQIRLTDQLTESKFSEIVLLKTQIRLLEEKIRMQK
jgi:transcriptional regulator with XRE-family HTH domain